MLVLIAALAASASGSPQPPSAASTARATATIRIVSSVRLKVGTERTEEGQPLKTVTIRAENGALTEARLAEFE
jgi:hypothetical protein